MPTVNPAPALCHRAPAGGAPSFHLCHISISHDIQNSLPPLAHGISCGLLGRPVALRTGPRRMGGRPRLRDRRPNHCGRPNHCSQRLHGVHRSRTARPVAAKLRRLGPNAGADGWQAGQGHLRGPVPPPRQWRMQRADGPASRCVLLQPVGSSAQRQARVVRDRYRQHQGRPVEQRPITPRTRVPPQPHLSHLIHHAKIHIAPRPCGPYGPRERRYRRDHSPNSFSSRSKRPALA